MEKGLFEYPNTKIKYSKKGPYKIIRHPSYAGAFLTYCSTPIFLGAYYSFLPNLIILSVAWIRRIHYEDKMLIENFGVEYADYCKSVKRIIPFVW